MKFRLKVLQGKLRNRRGESAGIEINIRRPRFLIGSGAECHLRCQSSAVDERHCELRMDGAQLQVRDLNTQGGTFVNDHPIASVTHLADGDQLRIGRLTFVVVADPPVAPQMADPMAEFVSELLVEADREERVQRMLDPRARQFQVEPTPEPAAAAEEHKPRAALQRPPRRPPVKLPPPPKYVADNTVEAAEEILKRILERPKNSRT